MSICRKGEIDFEAHNRDMLCRFTTLWPKGCTTERIDTMASDGSKPFWTGEGLRKNYRMLPFDHRWQHYTTGLREEDERTSYQTFPIKPDF
jgi:hypothetical protein